MQGRPPKAWHLATTLLLSEAITSLDGAIEFAILRRSPRVRGWCMMFVRRSLAFAVLLIVGCSPALRHRADAPPFADLSLVSRAGLEVEGFLKPEKLADRAGI